MNPIHSLTWRAFTMKAPPLSKSNEDGVILQTAPNIKIPWLQGYINQEVEDFII